MPTIHAALWERYGAHLPADTHIHPYLIRDKGFNDTIVQKVIENYRASFEFAKLDKSEDDISDGYKEQKSQGVPGGSPDRTVAPSPSGGQDFPPKGVPVTIEKELPILVGENKIARIPFPMTEEDYDLLLGTLALWKKRLLAAPPQAKPEPTPHGRP